MGWYIALTVFLTLFAAAGIGCLCFFGGCTVSLWLAREYKRDASEAVAAAEAKAYADHLRELQRTLETKKSVENSDIPLNPQEAQDNFEEGLARLHPGDEELQKEARRRREESKMMGR